MSEHFCLLFFYPPFRSFICLPSPFISPTPTAHALILPLDPPPDPNKKSISCHVHDGDRLAVVSPTKRTGNCSARPRSRTDRFRSLHTPPSPIVGSLGKADDRVPSYEKLVNTPFLPNLDALKSLIMDFGSPCPWF